MKTILDYSISDIEQLVASLGQKPFRVKQLVRWLYQRGALSYDDMTDLSKAFRRQLAAAAPLVPPVMVDKQVSTDGTRKYLLEFADGCQVETVGIPSYDTAVNGSPRRLTVCFSTQVGCPMRCSFCATGREGYTRNLTPGEMAWQVLACQHDFGQRVSNVVAMGQGEPFLNYDNLISALHIMNSPNALEIGARHISVSTCGILDGIRRFASNDEQFTLAVSLHSAIQRIRDSIMPGCAGVKLPELKRTLREYQDQAGRRVTFEYLMIAGITDTSESLSSLVEFCRGIQSHVNLLKVNDVEGSPLRPSSDKTIAAFQNSLMEAHIQATIRSSRGADIDGACGQLKNSRTH